MMVPIVGCSVIAVGVIIERFRLFLTIRDRGQANQMLALIQKQKYTDVLQLAERSPTLLIRVLSAGILSRTHEPERAMEAAGMAEIASLKRGLPALDTIITLAPLLGLLGTIVGMIDSFGIMAESGIGQPQAVTGGVAEALICTAAGIFVAVTTLIPYNYFQARIERYTELIEEYATQAEAVFQEASKEKLF